MSSRRPEFEIREDDLSGEQARGLLAYHLKKMHEVSPPGSVFALDFSGLTAPEVTVWTAWRGKRIAGIAAMKRLDSQAAEIKSMRIHPAFLRSGVGAALLERVISAAIGEDLRRLSLETGSGAEFEPALSLYRRRGFANGEAFADYEKSAFNQFLHLDLTKF